MIDAGGGDLCTTLGLGQYEGALSFVRIACLVAILVAGVAAEAALSRSKIFPEGGAAAGDYNFRRDTLVATFHDGTPTRRFRVTSYEYSTTW
jgi:hypothetical protein